MDNKEKLVYLLNKAYASETKAYRSYIHAAVTVTGPLRGLYEELFKELGERELHHLYEVGEKITAMGGFPTTECLSIEPVAVAIQQGYDATFKALQDAEVEALKLYKVIHTAATEADDLPLALLIEEIMQEEEEHHDELERILMDGATMSKKEMHKKTRL